MKFLKVFSIVLFSLFLFTPVVNAQYESNVIQPTFEDGEEVYGISTQKDTQSIVFYPEGCKSIDRVEITFKKIITDGQIRVRSLGENSPIDGKEIETPYEYCEFRYTNINESDISSYKIDSKIRKSWLESEGLDSSRIALYTYTNDKWEYNRTQASKDNTVYQFFGSEAKYSQYYGVGKYTPDSILPFGLSAGTLLFCCIILLFVLLILFLIFTLTKRRREASNR